MQITLCCIMDDRVVVVVVGGSTIPCPLAVEQSVSRFYSARVWINWEWVELRQAVQYHPHHLDIEFQLQSSSVWFWFGNCRRDLFPATAAAAAAAVPVPVWPWIGLWTTRMPCNWTYQPHPDDDGEYCHMIIISCNLLQLLLLNIINCICNISLI